MAKYIQYKETTYFQDESDVLEIAGVENAVEVTSEVDRKFTLATGAVETIAFPGATFCRVQADYAVKMNIVSTEYNRDYVGMVAVYAGGVTTIKVLKSDLVDAGYNTDNIVISSGSSIMLTAGSEVALASDGEWIVETVDKLQLVIASDVSTKNTIKIQETNDKVINNSKFFLSEGEFDSVTVTGLNEEDTSVRIIMGS